MVTPAVSPIVPIAAVVPAIVLPVSAVAAAVVLRVSPVTAAVVLRVSAVTAPVVVTYLPVVVIVAAAVTVVTTAVAIVPEGRPVEERDGEREGCPDLQVGAVAVVMVRECRGHCSQRDQQGRTQDQQCEAPGATRLRISNVSIARHDGSLLL